MLGCLASPYPNANPNLYLHLVHCGLNEVWLLHEKVIHNVICETPVCILSRDIINMFLVGQMSGFVKNFNIGIFSDTINVLNVTLCMMH